jgi:prepilin-type N-terminal cleavage/methylation domain-containing protein
MSRSTKKGFTLMELMVTVTLIVVLVVVATLNLTGSRNKTNLDGTTRQIGALLREAQSNAMNDKQGVGWGIHLDNTGAAPFYALFASSTYATSTIVGRYPLTAGIIYATATLPQGSAINITFTQITGIVSASTSITLYVAGAPSLSSTISIASSGAVSY